MRFGGKIVRLFRSSTIFSGEIKKNVILKKAGFSKILNEFTVNILSDLDQINSFQNEVYFYWSTQRIKFIHFIQKNYSNFFEFSLSAQVEDREGIYAFLKVKEGFVLEDIFAETGIIGVGINLNDGLYIRYAFGNVNYY